MPVLARMDSNEALAVSGREARPANTRQSVVGKRVCAGDCAGTFGETMGALAAKGDRVQDGVK